MDGQTTETSSLQPLRRRRAFADLCRAFMENQGWDDLFKIAQGEPVKGWVTAGLTGKQKQILKAPSFADRLDAYKLISSYGYGKPSELADPDSGRTVTDFLLAALGHRNGNGVPEAGPQ